MEINVLGTNYLLVESNEEKDAKLNGRDGYCDTSVKKLVVEEMKRSTPIQKEKLQEYKKQEISHELIHAFIYESGLDTCSDWGKNEEMVDWISIQFPKMIKAFHEAECI